MRLKYKFLPVLLILLSATISSSVMPNSPDCPNCVADCVKYKLFYCDYAVYQVFVALAQGLSHGGLSVPAVCQSSIQDYISNVPELIFERDVSIDPCQAMIWGESFQCGVFCSRESCTDRCCYAPDLYVSSLSYDNEAHGIVAAIGNSGLSYADAFDVAFKVDNNTIAVGNVSELNFQWNWMSEGMEATLRAPWNGSCGETYTVRVDADSANDVAEKDENNNYGIMSLTVKPEYAVSVDYTPANPDYGGDINITAHVTNRGPITLGPLNLTFYVNGVASKSNLISAPGYLEMLNFTHTISSLGSGAYNITVVVYPNEACGDFYEANNNATVLFEVGKPELYIEYFSCVNNCNPVKGQNFTLGFAVHLAGPDSLPYPCYATLHREGVGFPVDLDTWTIGYPNASNRSLIVNYTLGYGRGYLSTGIPGLWNFSLVVDEDNLHEESNEGNNRANLSIYVQSLPDFYVDNSSITFSTDNITEGYATIISAVVENTGNYTKCAWANFSYCPAGNAQYPCSYCSQYPHNVFTDIGPSLADIPGNGRKTLSVSWTPSSSQKFCIRVFVNATSYIPGVDIYWEPSYTAYTDVGVLPRPDFKSLSIWFSNATPTEGCNITVYSNVTNDGGSYHNFVHTSLFDGYPSNQNFIGNAFFKRLDNGEINTASIKYTANISSSQMYVYADPSNFVNESNENNNLISDSIQVAAHGNITADPLLNISIIDQEDVNYSINAPTCWSKVLFLYSPNLGVTWYNSTTDNNGSDSWVKNTCELTYNISSGEPATILLSALAFDAAGNIHVTSASYITDYYGWSNAQMTVDSSGDPSLANGTDIRSGQITDDEDYIYVRLYVRNLRDMFVVGIAVDSDNNQSSGDSGYEYDIDFPYWWWVEEPPEVMKWNGTSYFSKYNLSKNEYCKIGEIFQFKIPKTQLNLSDVIGLYYWTISDYNYSTQTWMSRDDTTGENYTLIYGIPPTIEGVRTSNVTNTSATISWNTNEPSNSVVNYGLTREYGKKETNASMVTYHIIALTDLASDSVYYFVVNSTDNANNSNTKNGSFVTAETFYETTMGFVANGTKIINASEANVTLYMATQENLTNMQVTVGSYSSNPTNSTFSVPGLNKYLQIDASPELLGNLSSVVLRVYYDEAEVNASNLNESNLGLYWFNESNSSWLRLNATAMSWVYGEGVNTSHDFVWANLSHLSTYTIGGNALSTLYNASLIVGWNLVSIPLAL